MGEEARRDEPPAAHSVVIACITIRMKPSTDEGSIQRITATRSLAGSTQVMLPPAPEAKKLASVALGERDRPVLSHHA